MTIRKVVPVVLRQRHNDVQILVFRHPLSGIQIVKGTVEENEGLEAAALRELFEESGIQKASIQHYLGLHIPKEVGPHWSVFLCEVHESLQDEWTHYCLDDGGLTFQFFWHSMSEPLSIEWHPLFQELFNFIQEKLKN